MYKKEYRTVVYDDLTWTTETGSGHHPTLAKMDKAGWEIKQYDKREDGKLVFLFVRPAYISLLHSLRDSIEYRLGDVRKLVYGKYDMETQKYEIEPEKCPFCDSDGKLTKPYTKYGGWYHSSGCPWGALLYMEKTIQEMWESVG